jgi:hypothetical protein
LNPGYPGVPELRRSLLFHHNTGLDCPTYNPAQPRGAQLTTNLYFPHSTSPPITQSYSYYSAMPHSMVPSLAPFPPYSIPPVTYASTVSSKGLGTILIATLMLVALDLVIIRPQKYEKRTRER